MGQTKIVSSTKFSKSILGLTGKNKKILKRIYSIASAYALFPSFHPFSSESYTKKSARGQRCFINHSWSPMADAVRNINKGSYQFWFFTSYENESECHYKIILTHYNLTKIIIVLVFVKAANIIVINLYNLHDKVFLEHTLFL